MSKNKEGFIAGLVGAGLFILLASFNIEAQGLYYDEVHQAPAAFVLFGKSGYFFTAFKWRNIPLLTMPYSCAIKSIIYGIFLKLTEGSFTVASWRMLGISFVALGLFGFCASMYKRLGSAGTILFFALFLTDTTVLLTSRHDWGPTALALSLRLLWLGIWVRGESGRLTLFQTFLLGLITGIAIYEKLSSAVLVLPLLYVMVMNKARRGRRYWLVCGAGIIVGCLPLLLINAWSFVKDGIIYSLSDKDVIYSPSLSIGKIFAVLKHYLSLGNGGFVRKWILGHPLLSPKLGALEAMCMAILGLTIIIAGLLYWRKSLQLRAAMVMTFCYLLIVLGLIFIPTKTWVHHLIIGTPFQYVGLSLFWHGISKARPILNRGLKISSCLFVFATIALLLCRLPIVASTVLSLVRGEASGMWDISYTKMAEFAVRHQDDSVFFTATWGVGLQIYVLSNGRDDLVYEIWSNHDLNKMRRIITTSGKQKVFLVVCIEPDRPIQNERFVSLIVKHIEQMPELHKEPIEPELKNLKAVKCLKYKYEAT